MIKIIQSFKCFSVETKNWTVKKNSEYMNTTKGNQTQYRYYIYATEDMLKKVQ